MGMQSINIMQHLAFAVETVWVLIYIVILSGIDQAWKSEVGQLCGTA